MKHCSPEESLRAWEANTQFWDERMGDASNRFHREAVRPRVDFLMDVRPGERVLDIACGNGNYSAHMARAGAKVVALDFSPRMIELARQRQRAFAESIEFRVADATRPEQLLALLKAGPFDKAVCNMAIMDMADISPLFACLPRLLAGEGRFVFATQHPCFVTRTEKYRTAHSYLGVAIEGQPQEHCYYHRSLQEIFAACFANGFVIDGFFEESLGEKELPDIIVVRARKVSPSAPAGQMRP